MSGPVPGKPAWIVWSKEGEPIASYVTQHAADGFAGSTAGAQAFFYDGDIVTPSMAEAALSELHRQQVKDIQGGRMAQTPEASAMGLPAPLWGLRVAGVDVLALVRAAVSCAK